MPISILTKIKGIESKINTITASSLRAVREEIDGVAIEVGECITSQLRNQLWNQARFQGLI